MDKKLIIERFLETIVNLEASVDAAHRKISGSKNHNNYLIRIKSWRNIVDTEKSYISDLIRALNKEDYIEVLRIINLIVGLSRFVKDDAQAILLEIQTGVVEPINDYN